MAFDCRDFPLGDLPHLTHVGELYGEPSVVFDTHTHLGFEIHVVRRGGSAIELLADRGPVVVRADDVLVMPPGIRHRFAMNDAATHVLWIGIQPGRRVGMSASHMLRPELIHRSGDSAPRVTFREIDGAHAALGEASEALPREPLTHISNAPDVGATVAEIVREATEARAHAATRTLGLLLSLITQIRRRLEPGAQRDSGGSAVARALRYIESRTHERVTLAEVAVAAGVSEAHLSRAFAAATGQTFRTFVEGRRLERARHLLALGYRTTDAARLFGFANPSGFCRWFARGSGHSPGEYARLALEGDANATIQQD